MSFRRLKELYLGIDGILMVIALSGLAASLFYFFQDDGLTSASHATMVPVGAFSKSHNDVRRRIDTGFTWSSVKDKEVVYEGDSIFTGDESEASIELQNGGRIQIDPKSLVVVKTQGSNLRLDLQYGSLVGKVNNEAALIISQNGQLQQLSGKNATVRIENNGLDRQTKIQVVTGEVTMKRLKNDATNEGKKNRKPAAKKVDETPKPVKVAKLNAPKPTPEPEEQILKQDEVVEIKDEAPPLIRKVDAQLLTPETGKILWLPGGQKVDFSWRLKSMGNVSQNRIEFSRNTEFKQPFFTTDVKGSVFSLNEEQRPQGLFLWRITPSTSDANSVVLPSAASSLTLYPDLPPLPVFPVDAQKFVFNPAKGEKGKQVVLSWSDQVGSTEFDVQLASDVDFKNVLRTGRTAMMSDQTTLLPEGTYYWHIRGLHVQRSKSPWSRTFSFNIEEEAHEPEVPKLTELNIKYEIPGTLLRQLDLRATAVKPEGLTPFTWSQAKDAVSYEVEVAPMASFGNASKLPAAAAIRSYAPSEVRPGDLFVRVRAVGKHGLVSAPSEVGKLNVTLPAPELNPIAPATQTYSSAADLEKGTHVFDVKWSVRPLSESYELEWGADREFNNAKKIRLKENLRKITVVKSMDYFARVRAVGPDGAPLSAFSNIEFTNFDKKLVIPVAVATPEPTPEPTPIAVIPPPAPPMPASVPATLGPHPAPLEPRQDSSVVSMQGTVPYINFKWKPLADAVSYEIQVSADNSFSSTITAAKSKKTYFTLRKALPNGKVYWRVRAKMKGTGESFSDWSEPANLKVSIH